MIVAQLDRYVLLWSVTRCCNKKYPHLFRKIAQKVASAEFTFIDDFQISLKSDLFLGYFCYKIC